ncbi:glutamate--tRNA ligase [Patescibacteria group bacterium]|nr:glutamate--tRNA ligase [Patescibacteria group bacterium]
MTKQNKQIRTRFAPSPTGTPHVGNIRTALFAYLFAKHYKGSFIVRIEDTDQSRAEQGSVRTILDALDWLGLDIDEGVVSETESTSAKATADFQEKGDKGPYTQSKRLKIYQEYAQKLIDSKHAYYCFCSQERLSVLREMQKQDKKPPRYDGHCLNLNPREIKAKLVAKTPFVIRMKIPEGETEFRDLVKGKITIKNETIDDQVLLKSDGFPTYHLASVVDDHLMEITHVLRADEWIASTPKHVLLYKYFGWDEPKWVHLPIILGEDKSKLSKRHGAVSILEYRKQGYLADAMINFLALLGWNPKTNQEILSREELIKQFDVEKINKNNPIFEVKKLNWMNKQYIKTIDPEKAHRLIYELDEISDNAMVFFRKRDVFDKALDIAKDRMEKLADFEKIVSFLWDMPNYEADILVPKGLDKIQTKANLKKALELMDKDDLRETFLDYCDKKGIKRGDLLWCLRVAVTGMEHSPEVFAVIDIIGKKEAIARIEHAIEKL